jgi:transcriptional regulator with XRE-family HTH domain
MKFNHERGTDMEAARRLLLKTMETMKWRAPQVAQALNCSDDVVRRWLRNERRMQLEDVIKLAKISGADLNEIFELNGEDSSPPFNTDQIKDMVQQEVQSVLGRIFVAGLTSIGCAEAQTSGARSLAERRKGNLNTLRSAEQLTAQAARSLKRIQKEHEETGYTRRRRRQA